MKTLRLKSILVNGIATIIAIVGISGFAFGQTTAKYSLNLKQEKTAISKDVSKIDQQQDKLKSLKQQCRDEHAVGIKSSATHSEIIKARADLNREKAYLRADKTALFDKHQARIDEHKANIREERAGLMKEKRALDADLAKGNSAAVARAEAIVNKKQEIKQEEAKLRQAKLDRNADVLAINKDIKNVDGQSALALSVENGSAKAQNLALK